MAEFTITFDATIIALAYRKGLEDGFILANETTELEQQLNVNQISTEDE